MLSVDPSNNRLILTVFVTGFGDSDNSGFFSLAAVKDSSIPSGAWRLQNERKHELTISVPCKFQNFTIYHSKLATNYNSPSDAGKK